MTLTRSSATSQLKDIWFQSECRGQSSAKTLAALREVVKDWEVLVGDIDDTKKKTMLRSRQVWLWLRWVLLCLGVSVASLTVVAAIGGIILIFNAGNWPLGGGLCVGLTSLFVGTVIYFCDKSEHPGRYRL